MVIARPLPLTNVSGSARAVRRIAGKLNSAGWLAPLPLQEIGPAVRRFLIFVGKFSLICLRLGLGFLFLLCAIARVGGDDVLGQVFCELDLLPVVFGTRSEIRPLVRVGSPVIEFLAPILVPNVMPQRARHAVVAFTECREYDSLGDLCGVVEHRRQRSGLRDHRVAQVNTVR